MRTRHTPVGKKPKQQNLVGEPGHAEQLADGDGELPEVKDTVKHVVVGKGSVGEGLGLLDATLSSRKSNFDLIFRFNRPLA